MISQIDEFRIPVVKGQESLDALLMQTLLKSFDELVTVDSNGMISIDSINLPEINYIDQLRVVNKKRIAKALTDVARQIYNDFESLYAYRKKEFKAFDELEDLQFDLETITATTLYLYSTLLENPKINMNVSATSKVMSAITPKQALRVLVNEAQQQIHFHTTDLYASIRKTTKSIIDSGVRSIVISNGTRRAIKMSSVVDSMMLDAFSQVQHMVFDVVDKDIQFTGVEISVHFNSAPDHEPVQGHQFTNEEYNKLQSGSDFSDVNNVSFSSIDRAIGTWNCRHIASPIIVGVSAPQFTQEELDEINNDNSKEVEILDRSMSKREAKNLATSYLRKANQSKEASKEAGILGDTKLSEMYIKKYLKYKKMYNAINNTLRDV